MSMFIIKSKEIQFSPIFESLDYSERKYHDSQEFTSKLGELFLVDR